MTVHFGKRNGGDMAATAGGNQSAANVGDTLYIPFAFYNDSGASMADTGLEYTDIEIFKNGGGTARATDSGVFLGDTGLGLVVGGTRPTSGQADTGNYTPHTGLYRCGIRIMNNTADTGFFDAGSFYHVALTGQSILGQSGHNKEVNVFIATFEIEGKNASTGRASIGLPVVDVQEIDGDTGPADNLGRVAADTGTGSYLQKISDTGGIADAVWAKDARTLTGFAFDTGINQRLDRFDTGVTETIDRIAADADTGLRDTIANVDTGAADAVWKLSRSSYTDTGSFGYGVNVHELVQDTGAAAHLAQLADEYDTGRLPAEATATVDTGAISNAVWDSDPSSHTDTGSFGGGVNISYLRGDTGAAQNVLKMANEYDTGRLPAEASATLDTGAINQAVWQGDASRALTSWAFDTGVQQAIARLDTGMTETIDRILADTDTGITMAQIADAVWDENLSGHQTANTAGRISSLAATLLGEFTITGTPTTTVVRITGGSATNDFYADMQALITSGSGAGQARPILSYNGSTGDITFDEPLAIAPSADDKLTILGVHGHPVTQIAAHVWDEADTGHQVVGTMGFRQNDTGEIANAIWAKSARTLTGFAFDTGIQQALARFDTGVTETLDRIAADADTGLRDRIDAADTGLRAAIDNVDTGIHGTLATQDTGNVADAIWAYSARTLTGFAFDTGIQQALSRFDTGVTETLDRIAADVDTGLRSTLATDTGVRAYIDDIDTGLRDVMANNDTGTKARLLAISTVTAKIQFDTGANEIHADIRKVNNIQITGTGDTGTANTWRPA